MPVVGASDDASEISRDGRSKRQGQLGPWVGRQLTQGQMTAGKAQGAANGEAKAEDGEGDEAMEDEEASMVDARSVYIGNVSSTQCSLPPPKLVRDPST